MSNAINVVKCFEANLFFGLSTSEQIKLNKIVCVVKARVKLGLLKGKRIAQ